MADYNPMILERLLQDMADKDYSTKTIRDVYNILNAMFKYAVHNRLITFNPCAGVDIPKTKTKTIRVLTVEEQREVLEQAKDVYKRQTLFSGDAMLEEQMMDFSEMDDVYSALEDMARAEINLYQTKDKK